LVVKYKDKTAKVFDSESGRLMVPLEAETQAEYPNAMALPIKFSRRRRCNKPTRILAGYQCGVQ